MPKPHDVRRGRLLRRLADEPGDVLAVLAPGGFGKSTLVAQWASAGTVPLAWVTVDRVDAQPEVLTSSILRAIGAVAPVQWGAGPLTGDEPVFTRRVLPRLGAMLGEPLTLVIDDIHHLSDERAARVLEVAVDCLPAGSRVALVGRKSVPGLPVPRWRGQGRVVDVSAADLAFDSVEVAQFLSSLCDEAPSVATVADVLESTAGWPVAVYLRARSGNAGVVTSGRHLEEYVDAEVLPDLDPDVLRFLRLTSVLTSLSVPLCDTVVDGTSSAALLHQAERDSRLVSRLDDHGEWFRVHPLVRERLARDFGSRDPDTAARCHHRAAEWFRLRGFDDEAVHHAVLSGDTELVASIVWPVAGKVLLAGQRGRVLAWLDATPQGFRERSPELAMASLWVCLNGGEGVAAARWADLTLTALGPDWEARLPDSPVGCAFAVAVALTGVGGYRHGAALAGMAFQALNLTQPVRPLARLTEGLCLVLAGEQQGQELIEEAGVLAQGAGAAVTEVQSLAFGALLRLQAGESDAAAERLAKGRALWERASLQESHAATVFLAAVQAYASGAAGDATTAHQFLGTSTGLTPGIATALPWAEILVEALSARTFAVLGHDSAAAQALQRCRQALPRAGDSPFLAALARAAEEDVTTLGPLADLTPAERRVWDLLQTRMTQREMADRLFVSPETVKTQTAAVYRKLGVGSRREVQELGERLRVGVPSHDRGGSPVTQPAGVARSG